MRKSLMVCGLLAGQLAVAQSTPPDATDPVTIPSGTKVLLALKNTVSTRNAKVGDGVYLQSTFPVVINDRVVIPAGTFVQGVVDKVKRSGRVKGRAEVLLHFTTLIYPNGYMLSLPGALESAGGDDSHRVEDKEGTVRAEGTKGRDAATLATDAGTGGLIGGLSRGAKGAAVGSGLGAAVGLATVLLTRGEEVRFEQGTTVEMIVARALTVDYARTQGANRSGVVPPPPSDPGSRRLERSRAPTFPDPNGPMVTPVPR
jgi:hypothetical protein